MTWWLLPLSENPLESFLYCLATERIESVVRGPRLERVETKADGSLDQQGTIHLSAFSPEWAT